jgi:hypothetical protein
VVPVGGVVSGGGGYYQVSTLTSLPQQVLDAAACMGPTGEVAEFNPGSRVSIEAG